MQKIILFCLLTIILSQDGEYIRRSFFEKHILVSTSLEIGKKATANFIKSTFENYTNYQIYPLEIFSQTVSGINFKVVFAAITETKKPSIFTVSIFYPDENSNENLQFKGIASANEIDSLKVDTLDSIEELLKKEYSKDIDPIIMDSYTDILYEGAKDNIYFVNLHYHSDDYAFVYKDSQDNLYLSYVIKGLNMDYEID